MDIKTDRLMIRKTERWRDGQIDILMDRKTNGHMFTNQGDKWT